MPILPLSDPPLLEAAERPGGLLLGLLLNASPRTGRQRGGGDPKLVAVRMTTGQGLRDFWPGLYLGLIVGSGGSAGDIDCRPARDSCDDGGLYQLEGCMPDRCVIENSLNYTL